MEIRIIKDKISLQDVEAAAHASFGDMVKAVVDIENKIMAMGGEWHSDAEEVLLQAGSVQSNLWGFNIYPAKSAADRLEFSSLINVRPAQGNRSMQILDETIRSKIAKIVNDLIS